ncbi:MAG: C25 family cysteine peptidase, partial [Planctomycetota bacterium]
DWEHLRKIRGELLDPNYDYTSIDELYQGNQGPQDAPGTPTPAMIASCINAGRGLINYCGHGRKDYWVYRNPPKTGTWYDFFSNGNVNGLVNDNELPFIFNAACSVGDFDGGSACFGETWLRATNNTTGEPTGAIGFYGASRTQYWSPPMEAQDHFNYLIVNEQYTSFGALCFAGSCSMMDKYGSSGVTMFNTWILFGDPSLNVMEAKRKYIYVDIDATGNNDGITWEDAYTDLEDALRAADDGTQIWVAEGTYTPGTSRSDEFNIDYVVGVQLYGGFDPDSGDDEWSERDWGENATILSGEIGEPTDSDNCYHVLQLEECDANTVIDGFTITDGYGSAYSDAGGIEVRESVVTIRNCAFDDNYAGDDGGAIYILDDSVLTVVNCLFIDNEAGDDGGAIAIDYDSRVTLVNCTFYENEAEDMGGSIYNNGDDDVNSIIANCIFRDSGSPYSNDDIYNDCDADPIISYCRTGDCGESGVDWDPDCGFDGGGNIDENPDFEDYDEGNDDKWMTCDDGFRLEPDSPCIDAGDNDAISEPKDITGNTRKIDDPNTTDTGAPANDAPYVDMGAYEYDSGC